jgi:hemerythrin-like metal-binding protein
MTGKPYLKWKDVYSVGNKELDDQHQYMFALLNQLYTALQDGDTEVPIEQLFDKARLYGKLHFETEERLMAACGYPGLVEHRAMHQSYCDRVEKMSQVSGPDAPFELFIFLKDWWISHITELDAHYAPWLKKRRG